MALGLCLPLLLVSLTQTPPPAPSESTTSPDATSADTDDTCDDDEEDEGPWEGSAGVGLVWLTGNSRELVLTGDVLAEYESSRWLLTLEADGTYGSGIPESGTEREILAEALGGWARGEYRLSPWWGVYAYTAAETNHLSSIELRTEYELGASLTVLESHDDDEHELLLRFYFGAHYGRDNRFQYYPTPAAIPSEDLWAPGISLALEYEPKPDIELSQYAFLFPNVIGPPRVLFKADTKLAVELTSLLSLAAHFLIESDSSPAPGKVTTDTSLTVGAEVEF